MDYRTKREKKLIKGLLDVYAELPKEASKLTMGQVVRHAEVQDDYLKFVLRINRLIDGNYLNFDENLCLEEIVELLKK